MKNIKSKILLLVALVLAGIMALVSCSFGTGGGEAPGNDDPENLIFSASSDLYVVCVAGSENEKHTTDLISRLEYIRSGLTYGMADSVEKIGHEIVVGDSSRPISNTALSRLERIDRNTDYEQRYLVYSNGESLAIVYDGDVAWEVLVDSLFSEYLTADSFSHREGVVLSGSVNVVEYYEEIDAKDHEQQWKKVEEAFSGLENKDEIVKSLKSLYTIYDRSMIEWLANLYEPNICVCTQLYGEDSCKGTKYCGSSAFYYSNSGRDTLGYLPDVESTTQAMTILSSTGLGGYSVLSAEMREGIGRFVLSLQDKSGFFYHPQWGKEFTDGLPARRGRDLNWATGILNNLGLKPIYDTPNGIKGSGILLSSSHPLGRSTVTAVASAVLVSSENDIPAQFMDKESFETYLGGMNLLTGSYGIGNTISAQISQIIARDESLRKEGADYSLVDILINWLNENMIEEVGHWNGELNEATGEITPVTNYFAVNGIMKISSIYTAVNREFPQAEKAALAAAEAITSDDPVKNVVDIYNNWYALNYLFNNISSFSSDTSAITRIRNALLERGPEVITATREKLAVFLKIDGSFSYTPTASSPSSQGCPVAIAGSNEGDVNATNLANSTKNYMTGVLGYVSPYPFGKAEAYIFKDIINNLKSVVKTDPGKVDIAENMPTVFDDASLGEYFDQEVNVTANKGGKGGFFEVVDDPREYREGRVLKVKSVSGAGEKLIVSKSNESPYADTFIFEGEFCVESTDSGYMLQLTMESVNMVTFRVSGGRIRIFSSSSPTAANSVDQDLGVSVEKGQWFKLKLVCYKGNHDTFRTVVWFDGDLSDGEGEKIVAVTDNYLDKSGKKITNGKGTPANTYSATSVYVMANVNAVMYLDNIDSYVGKGTYEKITDSSLSFNVDATEDPKRVFDFEDGIPEDVTVFGNALAEEGSLTLSAGSSVLLPVSRLTADANASKAELEITAENIPTSGDVLSFTFYDKGNVILPMLGYKLKAVTEGGKSYLCLYENNGSEGKAVEGIRFEKGETVTLTVIYYEDEKLNLIFINGKFINATSSYYSEIDGRFFGNLEVRTLGEQVSVRLDNIVAERDELSYKESIAPEIPSAPFNFDNGAGDGATLSGGATVKGGKLSVKGDGAKASFVLNERSAVSSAALLEVALTAGTSSKDGELFVLGFEDAAEEIIFAIAIVRRDGEYLICEYGETGAKMGPEVAVSAGEEFVLRIELYLDKNEAFVYIDGELKMRTGAMFTDSVSPSSVGGSFVLGCSAIELKCDGLISESLFIPYKKPSASLGNREDGAKEITFDYSSVGNLPSNVATTLGNGSYMKLTEVNNTLTDSTSKALMLHTVNGNNDIIRMWTTEKAENSSCIAFSADMMIDAKSSGVIYQLVMDSNYTRAYMINVTVGGGYISFYDAANKSGEFAAVHTNLKDNAVKVGEWFNIRVEFYKGSAQTVRFKVYINGEHIGTSSNYYRSSNSDAPINSITGAYIYTMNAAKLDIYIENVSIVESGDVFKE